MLARDETFKVMVKNEVIKPQETLTIEGIEDGTYFLGTLVGHSEF